MSERAKRGEVIRLPRHDLGHRWSPHDLELLGDGFLPRALTLFQHPLGGESANSADEDAVPERGLRKGIPG